MKCIQVIDDAINCTYDIFGIDDMSFNKIFPDDADVEFEDDLFERLGQAIATDLLTILWQNRLDKKVIPGIHGTLFFGCYCEDKKPFYPIKRESEMVANP
jgi:hypothetical protein